jgi:very-short-patch-repair endonuclease
MQAALLGWQILRPTTDDVTDHLMEVISMISRTASQRTLQLKVA